MRKGRAPKPSLGRAAGWMLRWRARGVRNARTARLIVWRGGGDCLEESVCVCVCWWRVAAAMRVQECSEERVDR